MRRSALALALVTAHSFVTGTAHADSHPDGDVLLTVTDAQGTEMALYDRAALEALPSATFETTTIWTDGIQEFTGVPLAALAEDLGIVEGSLTAMAVNDYSIEIPLADAIEGGPIIAYLNNGEPMSLREKGPLWVVYPYDSNDAYRSEIIYSRSIWQLDRLKLND